MKKIPDNKNYLYEEVSQLITQMIKKQTLKSGDKVPSLRKMSTQLKVSISTVSQAYFVLEEQGIIESRPQSGFYVCEILRKTETPFHRPPKCEPRKPQLGESMVAIFDDAREKGVIGLGIANPAPELLPSKALSRTVKRISGTHTESIMAYAPSFGVYDLRKQIAMRYSGLGKSIAPDEVIITNGATEALMISLQSVAKAGDLVAVAMPSYFSTLQMVESLGFLVLEIESDVNTGLSIRSLEKATQEHNIKAVINSCNFSNPTGSLMPEENKKALVKLLARNNIPLIEDDVYGDLYFTKHKPSSCKSFDKKGLVLHCNSFSKTIAPGFRIGWVLAGKFHESVGALKQLSSLSAPSLQQWTLAEFLSHGQYDRYLNRCRQLYKKQVVLTRNAIAEYFPENTRISSPQGGFTLWVQLPRSVNTYDVYHMAIKKKISITPGPLFSTTGKYSNCMRICAGLLWTPEVNVAIKTLGTILDDITEN